MRVYPYVAGQATLHAAARQPRGVVIGSRADITAWLATNPDGFVEGATFVIDIAGQLRLAPRRSEHVRCADGAPVLAAGEIRFASGARGLTAVEITNQSTGYCPEADSWPAVARALASLGVDAPSHYTHAVCLPALPHVRPVERREGELVPLRRLRCPAAAGVELRRGFIKVKEPQVTIDTSGEWWTGEDFADVVQYIRLYTEVGYPAGRVLQSVCTCGHTLFRLHGDPDQGCARRTCGACGRKAFICDSGEFWDEAEPVVCVCPCRGRLFEVGVGFSFRADGDVRWITVGQRCATCRVLGSFVDWKIDYGPTAHLLQQV
jgi:hypothetical protein